jgi:hypothetical protein
MSASFARLTADLIASVSDGETAMTSTLREMKSSMIDTWSAASVCRAGERVSTFTRNPAALASAADFSKNSVAVLNTPVMSGGVQPIRISCSHRASPPSPESRLQPAVTARTTAASAAAARLVRATSHLLRRQ